MTIGIDGSRAFLKNRTGIEEYSYQVIKHLCSELPKEVIVRIYVRKKIMLQRGRIFFTAPEIDFILPKNWEVRALWAPRFWTQVRLSIEMLFHPVGVLFIPAHTVPIMHPAKTVVTVHGLEYEINPQSYGFWERLYMRCSIQYSVKASKKVIAVSENTKSDIVRLYSIDAKKIRVIYEGYETEIIKDTKNQRDTKNYFLFVGRLEERKNIIRIVRAFNLFKENDNNNYHLILVGKRGFKYEQIEKVLSGSPWSSFIQETGYVTQDEKSKLLSEAKAFVFPSLYEGFGLPVLEAQASGTPVITSNISSMPEIGGDGTVYVNPYQEEEIAQAMEKISHMPENEYRIFQQKGIENVNRFSWQKCAGEIKEELLGA